MSSGTDQRAETRYVSGLTTGQKDDSGKAPISMIPRELLEGAALAYGYGAAKYERDNYRKGLKVSRTLDAAMRHIIAFTNGERLDPESGLNHLYHAAASLGMALNSLANHPDLDDVYKK